ncbi:M60 family metallopeptidase [Pontiella sp.]|uniref:M60 family metallopeptidase n=1 Tax=Pontiella sp. TaxID=2837462 RepID=UPI00356635B2
MKTWHGAPLLLGIGLALATATMAGGNSDQLLQDARSILASSDRLESDQIKILAAFKLIEQYESEEGPLFLNAATRNGLPRTPKDGLELHYAMLELQQALIDKTYTARNLKYFRRVLSGRKFETSAYFPGAVEPPANPNTVETAQINASQPTAWGQPVSGQDSPARRATGCYLAPGSIAVLRVPQDLINKGYSVRVGAHSWDLTKKPSIKRLDRVSIVYPIEERDTLIAHPLGGGIYIEVPYEADAGVVTIAFKNVVRAPFFSARSFDQTTLAQWNRTERKHPAPWADFESDKFMMQIPTAWLAQVENPVTLMADFDKAMDAISELFGHPLVRSKTVLYTQPDVNMRGSANFPGYPQSNYPYNPQKPGEVRHRWMVKGPQYADWTVFHEVGHSQFFSKFRGEIEADVNLPTAAILSKKFGWSLDKAFGYAIGDMDHLTMDEIAVMWMVTENFRQGNEMDYSNRPGDEFKYQHRGFGKYMDIVNLFGWDALGRFWKYDNENWKPGMKVPNNNDPVDDRILRLSRAAGADLTPLIHFWGIHPENPSRLAAAMEKEGLKPSRSVYDRLQHYKTVIPMDNEAFRAHCKRVYPNGVSGRNNNPNFGPGWYEAQLPMYTEKQGQAAQAALQDIIDRYFTNR